MTVALYALGIVLVGAITYIIAFYYAVSEGKTLLISLPLIFVYGLVKFAQGWMERNRKERVMKIYQVIIEDRHCDPKAIPFVNKDKAIEYAKNFAEEQAAEASWREVVEKDFDGYLYCATWSFEEDWISVGEEELRE